VRQAEGRFVESMLLVETDFLPLCVVLLVKIFLSSTFDIFSIELIHLVYMSLRASGGFASLKYETTILIR
jgi:hypothetical protein